VLLPESQHGQAPCFRRTTDADMEANARNDGHSTLQRCCVLVMEFCGYGTLLNALQMDAFKNRDGSPNMSLICSVLLEIASALQYTHAYGIIHCDIKPQNVLLKPDDSNPRGFVTKLADFGLARVVTQDIPLLNGDSAGTPSHLAPEIVKFGERESIKTAMADIYALGVLMWELLVSRQAFSSVDKQAVLTHVVVQRRRLPLPPNADQAYCKLCRQCWDADMDARPSLTQILEDLKCIMQRYTVRPSWLAAPDAAGASDGHGYADMPMAYPAVSVASGLPAASGQVDAAGLAADLAG
jgi:serine/threonine protein kinase